MFAEQKNIPVIFLAFANNQDESLSFLQEEYRSIVSHLRPLEDQGLLRVFVEQLANARDIIEGLSRFKEDLIVFHFAGQMGGLSTDDFDATSLLKACRNLQFVFLNGSSTKASVTNLLELGIPGVIATQSSINDTTATRFADQFYGALARGYNLKESFDRASAYLQTFQTGIKPRIQRGVFFNEKTDASPWGLYLQNEDILKWKLPSSTKEVDVTFAPEPAIAALELSPFLFHNHYFSEGDELRQYGLYQFSHYDAGQEVIHYKSITRDKTISIGSKDAIYRPIWQSFQSFWRKIAQDQSSDKTAIPEHPQQVHALLIGINQYPTPLPQLKAPQEDVIQMRYYLESQPLKTQIETLSGTVTRQNIIDTLLKIMGNTSPGDAVIFYFSGLGQKEQSPNPADTIPAILCHDQLRMTIDEIVYLVCHQKEKALHPIIILDIGVNEINNKEVAANGLRSKGISPTALRRPWEDYVFASAIPTSADWEAFMQEAAFVLMVACDYDKESAYEQGESSLFTQNLIAVLKRSRHYLSYQDLNNKLLISLGNSTYQHPKIRVEGEKKPLLQQSFLGQAVSLFQPTYGEVTWNPRLKRWTIDMGTNFGLKPRTILHVCELDYSGNALATLGNSFVDYAEVLFGETSPDKDKKYFAFADEVLGFEKVKFRFGNPQIAPEEMLARHQAQFVYDFPAIEFTAETPQEDFVIWLDEASFSIAGAGQKEKYFIKEETEKQPLQSPLFTKALSKISHWYTIKTLDNYSAKGESISPLIIDFLKIREEGDELLKVENGEVFIPFDESEEGEEPKGQIRIRVTNPSEKKWYCTLLYLSMDFQVATGILGSNLIALEPGAVIDDIKLTLFLDEMVKRDNWFSAYFFIKTLISDQPFDASFLAQGNWDFPISDNKQTNAIKSSTQSETFAVTTKPEWMTSLIKITQPNPFYREEETISPTVPHPFLANLGRTEQIEQFAVAIRNPNLPYQVSLLPAPPKSAPNHALLQLKSAFEEVIKDNYFVFDTVSFAAKEGLEGVKRHLPNILRKWRNLKTPPNTATVLAPIHFEGDWYGHRTELINWLQSEAEKLFDLPFKQTIVAIALDLPEVPDTGSFQKVFRRNNADEQIGWLRNVAKSFDAVTLLPSLGKLSWEDIDFWLTRNEAELRHLFPEWPAADFLRKQLGEAKEGYDMETVLEVLEKNLTTPNDSAT